jgi:hypothetical protein
MISSSPGRGLFHIDIINKKLQSGELEPEEAEQKIEFFKSHAQLTAEFEARPEWQINNMEHDLRSTDWILAKVRASNAYAQNLYAVMCNNEFQKNDVWPLLKGTVWGCSWRHAGGIVADMQQTGDYMNWYCSGIRGDDRTEQELQEMTPEQHAMYMESQLYVGESHVTDEIRQDLFRLGWLVCADTSDPVI